MRLPLKRVLERLIFILRSDFQWFSLLYLGRMKVSMAHK